MGMRLRVDLERETGGRWIAQVVDLPSILDYGTTGDEALAGTQALAQRVVADQLEDSEAPITPFDLSFVVNGV